MDWDLQFLELVGREFDAIKLDCILDKVGQELDGYIVVSVCVIPDTGVEG